jgi:hypothetical protein
MALRQSRIAQNGAGVAAGTGSILTERTWRESSTRASRRGDAHDDPRVGDGLQSVSPLRGGQQDGQRSSLRVEESDGEGQLGSALAESPTRW